MAKISNPTLIIIICIPLLLSFNRVIQTFDLILWQEVILILAAGIIAAFSIAFILIKFRKEK